MRLRYIAGAKETILDHPKYIIDVPRNHSVNIRDRVPNNTDVHLEIGMGKGQFIYTLASQYPNEFFIGVEMFDSVALRALEKVIEKPLDNLLLLRGDIQDIFPFIPDDSIRRIYLNFSDPWPKARHEKRRLTYHKKLSEYQRILQCGGDIHLKTDNVGLFEYSVESMKEYPMELSYITKQLHQEQDNIIMTEFEEKYKEQGKPIFKIIASFEEETMDPLYKDLVNLPGASGFEHRVRDYMKTNLNQHTDTIVEDKLGSVFGVINKGSKGPKLMIAGHMDEVGAVVTKIQKNGLIKMTNLGGVHGNVFLSQHMNIIVDYDTVIPGITASKPPHLTRGSNKPPKPLKFNDLLLDIGADSKEHAEELGVKIGQQIVPYNNYTITKDGKKIISKAWDDRFGCGMALEIARDMKDKDLDCELYTGATVQEEVGLRGAQTAANLIQPDVFLAIDCSPCADVFDGDDVSGTLGDGFLLRFYDPRAIMHQGMKKLIVETAEKKGIKFQYYKSMGGTDAARVQLAKDGVLVATIGMPARYIHSTTSMIHTDDYKEVKKMVYELITMMNDELVNTIKSNV